MPITLVQSKTLTVSLTTTATVTFDDPITAGNHVVLIASAISSGVPAGSVADSLGNVFNQDFTTNSGSSKLLELYSARVDTAGTCSITYTVDIANSTVSVEAQEWSGLYPGAPYGGGPGAGWIDHGQGNGLATPPPLLMNFATDFPVLANYYGTTLPLVAVTAGLTTGLVSDYEIFPNADRSVTVNFPTVTPGTVGVFIVVLYVGPTTPVSPLCNNPPDGVVTRSYTHTFAASGGTAPYFYSLSSGTLPDGLTLSSTGTVSGRPTAAGTFSFTLLVVDSRGLQSTLSCSITIIALAPGTTFLELWVWRELHRFAALDEDLNFPPGYAKALIYALSMEFFAEYPAAARKYEYDELLAESEDALKDLEVLNASDAVAMEPPL